MIFPTKPGPQPENQIGPMPKSVPINPALEEKRTLNHDAVALSNLVSIIRNVRPEKKTDTLAMLMKIFIEHPELV